MDGKNQAGFGAMQRALWLACAVALLGACQSAKDEPSDGVMQPAPQMTAPVTGGTPPPGGAPVAPPTGAGATPPPAGTVPPATTPPPGGDVPPPAQPQAGSEAPPAEPMAGSGADPMVPTEPEPTTPPSRMDLGVGDGKDVVTIGDSWMTLYSGGIEGALDRAGKNYRHYGVAGTTLIGGDIPQQWERSKAGGAKASTVIMTGGGNDIMFTGGCNTTEACEMSVAAIGKALNELWTKMSADGVQDVIYVQYSKDAGTTPQGTRPTTPPPPPAICVSGPIHCYSLPTTDLVMGQLVDGIHPSGTAHDRIAKALLDLMETNGMRR